MPRTGEIIHAGYLEARLEVGFFEGRKMNGGNLEIWIGEERRDGRDKISGPLVHI